MIKVKQFFCYLAALLVTSAFSPQPQRRIIFFGDSITEAAVKPGGFISLLNQYLTNRGRAEAFDLVGAGIGGNKVYDLYLRMDDDVLAKNPDQVVIWIGVNDVWHKQLTGTGTDADKFAKFYTAIIKKLQTRNIGVILCTPATIGEKTDCTNQEDGDLNKYAQIVRDLAKFNGCRLLDLRRIFLDYDAQNNPENKASGILTMDGVHLNDRGNNLVAEKMEPLLFNP